MVTENLTVSSPKIALNNRYVVVIQRGRGWGVTAGRCGDNGARRGTTGGDELRLWRLGGGDTEFKGIMLVAGWEVFLSLFMITTLILYLITIVSQGLVFVVTPLVIIVPSWVVPSVDSLEGRTIGGVSGWGRADSATSSPWDSAFWTRLLKSRRRLIIEIINWGWGFPDWSCFIVSATKGCYKLDPIYSHTSSNWRAVGRLAGSFTRQREIKSTKDFDHLPSFWRRGGGRLGIMKIAYR